MYQPTRGTLDPTFGAGGKTTTAFAPGTGQDATYSGAVQPDGRIVAVGTCSMGGATGDDICLARYGTNGILDPGFGAGGKVTIAIAPGSNGERLSNAKAQADGRIVTAGQCYAGAGTGVDVCVARYGTTGVLDTTFGSGGRVITPAAPGSGSDIAVGLRIQPDGRIVTAGVCSMGGASTGNDICLVRYNANGTLDAAFGTGGKVTTAVAPGAGSDGGESLELMADGALVAATGNDICLVRYLPSGALDPAFDGDGRLTTPVAAGAGYDVALNLTALADGRLVAIGACDTPSTGLDACLAQNDNAGSMSQYVDAVTDWDTPATSMFGACLVSVTNGTPAWSTSATCPTTDGAYWNAVPAAPTQIATAIPNTTTATAQLRFGLRAAANQRPGAYVAPVTFDVLVP